MKKRVGFGLFRIQPAHRGHFHVFNRMAMECEEVYIGVGSTNQPSTASNPWPFEARKQMIQNVMGNRVKVIPFADIGSESSTTEWCDYVLEKLEKLKLAPPTDYYTGTPEDGSWYKQAFYNSYYDEYYERSGKRPPDGNVMHIVKRDFIQISGTEVRKMLQFGDQQWMDHIPRVNHELVEATFPKNLIVKD